MTTQQNINQRLLSLDSTYSDFILSDYLNEICGVFIETNNLDEAHSIRLENGFVLLMTFFFDRTEFITFAEKECGLPDGQGELLLEGFLQALPPSIVNAYEEIYNQTFSITNNILESEILEAEALLNAIPKPLPQPPEAVYTSTQSAILTEARIVPTPPPTAIPAVVPLPPPSSISYNAPRWETQK